MMKPSKNLLIHHLSLIKKTKEEIAKIIVDQEPIIDGFIRGMMCGGHILLEGVPGIAKTAITKTISSVSGCNFSRIQFTADLLPSDIIGITAYEPNKGFYTIKGPIFSNFILADEINRAPPKVQAALLESMQERQVTIGKRTYTLPNPFFILATVNPIETLGVYPLPEAQIDRFLFKLKMDYTNLKGEQKILTQNTTLKRFEDYNLKQTLSPRKITELQKFTNTVYIKPSIGEYIVRIVDATRNPDKYGIKLGKYIEYGASPRASIGLFIASKADAILKSKLYVTPQNVKDVAHDVLRHRILLNYEGQAEEIKTDDIVAEVLQKVSIR